MTSIFGILCFTGGSATVVLYLPCHHKNCLIPHVAPVVLGNGLLIWSIVARPTPQLSIQHLTLTMVSKAQMRSGFRHKKTIPAYWSCSTTSGDKPNQPCKFPFIKDGVRHLQCAGTENKMERWCATATDEQDVYIDVILLTTHCHTQPYHGFSA